MRNRRFFYSLILVVLLCGPPAAFPASPPETLEIGQVIPEAALQTSLIDLSEVKTPLADLWGSKGALLVFTANTCPYATDWMDRYPRLAQTAAEQGLSFLLINANARKRKNDDSPKAMAALAEQQGFSFPYWIDRASTLADLLGATRTPEVFLFDEKKALVYQGALDDHSGPFENVTQHWTQDALNALGSGNEITTRATPPLGCAILRPRKRRQPQTPPPNIEP